ncbi:MAG: GTP-binding protein, partial [Candidatus Helarchaeota archaeon]|nr:GTP-binding protein [Candidatus Helarchaeota archaeon]
MSPIYSLKLVLFGNQAVGKTSLVERYINNKFEQEYLSTLGYNVYQKSLDFDENTIIFIIFDIGGQERFKDLRKKYATGANAALLVYDITNRDSFDNIRNWHNDLMEFTHDPS